MNAMKFFLYRFRDELGIKCTDYELFGSVFPELLPSNIDDKKEVDSRVQATSRYGDKEPRQLLSYIARSPFLPDDYTELRETIAIIERHSHNGRKSAVDAMRRLTKRSATLSYAGIFDTNMSNLATKALTKGESFDNAAKPFLVMFSQQDAKNDVTTHLRTAWNSARENDEDGLSQAREHLWRWCVHDKAKDQLASYVRSLIVEGFSRNSVLGRETVSHYRDKWNKPSPLVKIMEEDDEEYRRGLGFVFSKDFRKDFSISLHETFAVINDFSEMDFWDELIAIATHYDDPSIDNKNELKDMVDAVTMCILAALVGPGSFSKELGRALPGETETNATIERPQDCFELIGARVQPVVLTDERTDTYFTQEDSGASLAVESSGSIRFGRDVEFVSEGTSGIRFSGNEISRNHAEVFRRDKRWFIRDLGSTYGTLILRVPPRDRVMLYSPGEVSETAISSGDIIVLAPINALNRIEIPLGKPNRALRFEIVRFLSKED